MSIEVDEGWADQLIEDSDKANCFERAELEIPMDAINYGGDSGDGNSDDSKRGRGKIESNEFYESDFSIGLERIGTSKL